MSLEQRLIALIQVIAADIAALVKAAKRPMVCDSIESDETVTIPAAHQLIVAGRLTNSGTLINNGRLHIL